MSQHGTPAAEVSHEDRRHGAALLRAHADAGDERADALRAIAAAIEPEKSPDGGDPEPNSGDGWPRTCPCGREWASPQAWAAHAKACPGEAEPETPKSDGSGSETPKRYPVDHAAFANAREAFAASGADEDARDWLRERKYGREGWAAMFGQCAKPSCELGANGFAATHCASHTGEPASEDADADEDAHANLGLVV